MTVKEMKDIIEDMRKVCDFKDENTDISIYFDAIHIRYKITLETKDEKNDVMISLSKHIEERAEWEC